MGDLRLRFSHREHTELALGAGVHAIGRIGGDRETLGLLDSAAESAVVRFCVDRRGVWLRVTDGARGVHVNGREVRRIAMLRVGDAIYIDGVEMRLVSAHAPETPGIGLDVAAASDAAGDPRVVLRGVGGQYHGRSFTLERPRLIGRHADADIRIDEPAFADRHARLELFGEQIVLRDLGSTDGSVVNGENVRDALLQSGDQIVFDAHHRFVVEAPSRTPQRGDPAAVVVDAAIPDIDDDALPYAPHSPVRRLPWLLLAAALIAALLAALLLFGSA
ncbi:MAG: FHA domain-containing protein [Luteimonas sp.]